MPPLNQMKFAGLAPERYRTLFEISELGDGDQDEANSMVPSGDKKYHPERKEEQSS